MPIALEWQAWFTLAVILTMLAALLRGIARPELVLFGSLAPLLVAGVISPEEAFAGLSNSAVLTVGALFIVAAGVQNTGALTVIDAVVFPRSKSIPLVTFRLMGTSALISAFLNNTPIVAMLIPRVRYWCEQNDIAPSKLMIPLSYASIVGGMTTLIGTSTNLLVAGLMEQQLGRSLGLFDLAWVGVPAALATILYFTLIGHRQLPGRLDSPGSAVDLRHFYFEVEVPPRSSIADRTIEEAGLRALGDAFLLHIIRNAELIPSSPELAIREGDVLAFRGSAAALDRIMERHDLRKTVQSLEKSDHVALPLYEAVIAPTSRLVDQTLVEAAFRETYQGVVLGIYRQDERLEEAIGRVRLKPGDLLLIEARAGFDKRWRQDRDEFYLIAPHRPEKIKPQKGKAPLALGILIAVVATAAFGVASIVTTSFVGAVAMILTGCLRGRDARAAVDVPVLLVIAAALGLGKAIETTGLADAAASLLTEHAFAFGTIGVLAAVYFATSLLTEVITNNAAVALMLGVGLEAAELVQAPPEAFAIAIAIAASASFLTPIGYQTNMMVMSAGGYRFGDFMRAGLAANLIVGVTAVAMIAIVWL